MALSPNYGWAEPDDSSLVKNGAQDIRALGDAIDASLWAVGYGQAGKNKIINGDFGIWQRGTSFSFTSGGGYTSDRFQGGAGSGGTVAITRETFTAGQTDVPNAIYFFQAAYSASGTDTVLLDHRIEDVNTLAGQPATFSFYAKVNTGTKSITPRLVQDFGSGGSSTVVTNLTAQTLTTSWQRFTISTTIPSVSGKTIGASSYLRLDLLASPSGTLTYGIANVQLEYGSKATPFETATGTIQGELAACQRYYYSHASGASLSIGNAGYYSASQVNGMVQFPVSMRTAPSLVATTGTDYYIADRNGASDGLNSLTIYRPTSTTTMLYNSSEASGTAGHAALLYTNNASSSVAFSAEL